MVIKEKVELLKSMSTATLYAEFDQYANLQHPAVADTIAQELIAIELDRREGIWEDDAGVMFDAYQHSKPEEIFSPFVTVNS
jgi:hypothetical protein